MNSESVKKEAEIDIGKGKKRKLFSMEDGSETSSKRRLDGDDMEYSNKAMAKETGELWNFTLPNELLVKIIEMIPISQWVNLESVNHQFQDVVHGLWGKLNGIRLDELAYNKEKNPYQVVEAILEKFLIRTPNIASISGFAEYFNRRTSIRLPTIRLLSKFKHLQTIDFSGQKVISAGTFVVFLESSASRQCWKSLNIYGGIYGMIKCQNVVGNKNQPALNLDCFKFNMDTTCFSTPIQHVFDRYIPIEWSALNKLVIVGSHGSANEILSVIRQCTQVAHLDVSVPQCGNGTGQPSYADFMQGMADLVNLSVLKINGQSPYNRAFDDALLVLIQNLGCRGVTELALVSCDCSDQIVGAIIDHLRHLKSLELNVTKCKASLQRLANTLGKLETLKIRPRWDSKVDGTCIQAIVGNMAELQCLHLEYPKCNSEDFTILGELRNLKELRIMGEGLKSETIEIWGRLGFGSCIETVELKLQDGFSSKAMGSFLKAIPRLHSMRLSGVTDDILQVIIEFCPNLIELYINFLSTVTCTGIQSVIDNCSELKVLNVAGHSEWFPSAVTVGKYRKIVFKSERDACRQ